MIRRRANIELAKMRNAFRCVIARYSGIVIGENCRVGPGVDFELGQRDGREGEINIGAQAWIERGAVFWAFGGTIQLERTVFVGPYSVIYGHGGVEIGEETLVSMHCCILSSNHAVLGRSQIIRRQHDVLLRTRIGRDVWLGAGVKVLGGVTVGDGCVVGAGAVVSNDLPPYSIALGVPARIVGERGQ